MTALLSALDHWRQRLGGRRRVRSRPLAAMGYLTAGPASDDLIEVENLTLVLLSDEQIGAGHCALRLAGYSGQRVRWGVRFGGPGQCRFRKDLALQPVPGGQGYRLDLANEELLTLALGLERQLDRHARFCLQERERPFLPKLWAAFPPQAAAGLSGDGPELAAYAARVGRTPASVLQHLRRDHQGLATYPLAWTSHHWRQAVAVFADLRRFPPQQVFRLPQRGDLAGFHDAAEYDFRGPADTDGERRPRRRQPLLATA